MLAMPGKDQVRAEIGMSMLAKFTMPAGDSGINRHALAILCDTCELMSQHKWVFQFCVTDRTFREPMQIRAAHTHRCHAVQFLPDASHRNFFIMDSQISHPMQTN